MNFGWCNVAIVACHAPCSHDYFMMTLPSPTSKNDWFVYMPLPGKHMNYIDSHVQALECRLLYNTCFLLLFNMVITMPINQNNLFISIL
ncbi:hypothetical protein Hanom_Chr00s024859g01764101 [Helianthus anomalus]